MQNDIKELKYAVFSEWSYDPPAGAVTFFYDAYGNTYEELMEPISEIYDHLEACLYGNDLEELIELYENTTASYESLSNYAWDNGGLGCDCTLLCQGDEIVSEVITCFDDWIMSTYDNAEAGDKKACEDVKIIDNAKNNPGNYEAVEKFLNMISEYIDDHNSHNF